MQNLKGKIEFFEKFGQMLNSGVPLLRSLTILSEEVSSKEVRLELQNIIKNLEVNDDFYKCFDQKFFNQSTIAMIETGEKRGELDYICIKISNCLKAELSYHQQ